MAGTPRFRASKRSRDTPPSGTVALSDRVRALKAQGKRIINLTVGEPDFPTPPHVIEAGIKALREGKTKYGPSQGIPELREAVADDSATGGVVCEAANVLVTPAKQAILTALMAVVDPGDEVLVPTPAWMSFQAQTVLCGGRPVEVPVTPEGRLDQEAMKRAVTPRTKAVIINSPCNPTGAVLPRDDVKFALELARDNQALLISDELYCDLIYEGTGTSPVELQGDLDGLAIIGGVSKSYSMTGWRIGWMIASKEFLAACDPFHQHSITHPTLFAQYGAVAALTGPREPLIAMRDAFRRRRDLVAGGLEKLGARFPTPRGAFYLFPHFEGHDDGHRFALGLLDRHGVAVVPGEVFGPGGEGHMRISYAASEQDLEGAIEGFRAYLEAPTS